MNAPVNPSKNTALAVADSPYAVGMQMDAASLILGPSFERVQKFASLMSKGFITVPKHLQGNDGDCMAVTLAALSRRMDPFAFAQKTHVSKSGVLGYESQLIKAMILTSGKVDGPPDYEFLGDWNRVLGKVEEKTGQSGGKYYAATYKKEDEEGLGVIIKWRLRGEQREREMTVMLSQCYPRFSTQWATDPQQQICYVADRKFARRHTPEVLLGVYDIDELEPQEPKFMGPADEVTPGGAAPAPKAETETVLPKWTDADIKKREAKIQEFYSKGKTSDDIIAFYSLKATLSDALKKLIVDLKPKDDAAAAPKADEATDVAPKITFALVADKIVRAQNEDEWNDAGTLIGEVADPAHRAELTQKWNARGAELKGDAK